MTNEKIKELAEQAMIFSSNNGGWRISTHVPNDFKEKFAELIVQECCDIFVELRTRPADLAVLDVKKHFGVK